MLITVNAFLSAGARCWSTKRIPCQVGSPGFRRGGETHRNSQGFRAAFRRFCGFFAETIEKRVEGQAWRADAVALQCCAVAETIETLTLRAAIDGFDQAIVLLDGKQRIVAASRSAEALVGDTLPRGVRAVRVLCGAGETRPIAEALAQGRPAAGTVIRPRPDGRDIALRIFAKPLANAKGWLLRLAEDAPGLALDDEILEFHGMLTADTGMKRLLHVATKAAAADVTVLVRGETGTGKELLARAIHELSARRDEPFRAINCAALSPTLLESELFGHVRGAFTGAVRDNPGHFRSAHRGTLFLDEVAEMPGELQAKLLRVIETGTVLPVGAIEPIEIDVRLVAATHKSLREEVHAGRFRADLMYRLRKVPLFLPPLRERGDDTVLLARHLLTQLADKHVREIAEIDAGALTVLRRYAWPGNVRELANALEYAFVVGEGPVLTADDLPPELISPALAGEPPGAPVNRSSVGDAGEAARILRALERSSGNRSEAARLLGISRVTLWRRMKELEIAVG
ncbi:MAG: AAA family ATPase [Myxococcales bacterium FL481]|nr:MAG: AAA family ATPase [Myxococcales bacterium FL481]